MNELYWITRFYSINATIGTIIVLSIIVSICAFISFNCGIHDGDFEYCERVRSICKKLINITKISFVITIISTIAFIFTPSQKEAYLIWGLGGTIDYLKENPAAKQIPDKCVKLLDKWVTDELENDSIK
jgi:hypothetical protein